MLFIAFVIASFAVGAAEEPSCAAGQGMEACASQEVFDGDRPEDLEDLLQTKLSERKGENSGKLSPEMYLEELLFFAVDNDNDGTVTHSECVKYLNHPYCIPCIGHLVPDYAGKSGDEICASFEIGDGGFKKSVFMAKLAGDASAAALMQQLRERKTRTGKTIPVSLLEETTGRKSKYVSSPSPSPSLTPSVSAADEAKYWDRMNAKGLCGP